MKRNWLGCLLSLSGVSFATLVFSPATVVADDGLIDVFVSGTGAYNTYRIPTLTMTPDGTLLAICEGRKNNRGDRGNIDLVSRRSKDLGKTWEPMQLVYEEGGDSKTVIGNACPVVDQETKTIWLPFCRDNRDVFVTFSKDDGQIWATPRNITQDAKRSEWGWYATGPGNGIQLTLGAHKGRLVIPCDHRIGDAKGKDDTSHSHVIYSDDHGKTWKLGGVTESRMNECAVVELSDGTLMLNMRSFRGNFCRAVSRSRDGGMTWTAPVDDHALIESACQGSLIVYQEPEAKNQPSPQKQTDRLLVFSNPATTKGRNHLTLRLSRDEGKTWPATHLVYPKMSAYSSIVSLPANRVAILFERDTYKQISFTTVGLTEFAAKSE